MPLPESICDAETAPETSLWHKLVPTFTSGELYLFDLGFFERALFASANAAGAHVLMRLKSTAKVKFVGHMCRHRPLRDHFHRNHRGAGDHPQYGSPAQRT